MVTRIFTRRFDLANAIAPCDLQILVGLLAVGLVMFVKSKAVLYLAIIGRWLGHLHNLPFVLNCLVEIASFGVSGGERIDVTPIFPLR